MLLPRKNVIYSYVIENYETKKITDFVSFYNLPSTILKKSGHTHDQVKVNYLINILKTIGRLLLL